MKRILTLIISFLSFTAVFAQKDIKVSVHNVVEVGEQFNVTFEIEGNVGAGKLEWTPGEGFELLWGPQYGHSSSTSFINGKKTSSSQSTFTYVLRCDNPGKYIISPATANIKNKVITSQPVTIEVVQGHDKSSDKSSQVQSSSTNRLSSDNLFMRFEFDKRKVVVGEPIHAKLKLYLKVDIVGLEGFYPPQFNGFWAKETASPQTLEFNREKYNDQIWSVATIKEYILIPQQSGELKISPAQLICLVNVMDESYGTSALDLFFNSGYKTVNKKLSTSAVTISVDELPQPAPLSYIGAVGDFSVSASLQNDSLKVGDASSLIIKVKGKGNISLFTQPSVAFPPDFESYDVKVSERLDASGIRGEKTYEFPFIPRSSGDFEIPSVEISYYDISAKKYISKSTGSIPVSVAKLSGAEALAQSSSPNVVKSFDQKTVGTLNKDIRYIARDHKRFVPKGTFLLGGTLFWVVLLTMIVVCVAFAFIWNQLAARRADVVKTRTRKASKMAMKRLKDAKKFLDQNKHGEFYEEMHKALLGFVADKLNVPYGELSRERISGILQLHGVGQDTLDEFLELLDDCEFARYAPSAANKNMSEHYNKALDVISSLDSNIKKSKDSSMKSMLIALIMLLLPFGVGAANEMDVDSLWNAGNAAYAEGKWEDAIEAYSGIEAQGLESEELYFNIGNAYYKEGDIPMSILYYKRSLALNPSNKDTEYNLSLAQGMIKDKIDPVPEFILKTWMRDFCYIISSNSWTIIFLVMMGLTLVLVLVFFLSTSVAARKTGFFTGLVSLIMAILSLSMALWQRNSYMNNEAAVVMSGVVSVKSSPSEDNSTELFLLHEGTTIDVLQEVEDWYEIRLVDGRRGWLLSRNVEKI